MPAKVKFTFFEKKIKERMEQASIHSLNRAGFIFRKEVIRSIQQVRNEEPSLPGTPPHSQTGKLRVAIRYNVDKNKGSVVIGPRFSVVRQVGRVHEEGLRFKKTSYPKRPFMAPELERIVPRLPRFWARTIS